jgi:hypothetical protein
MEIGKKPYSEVFCDLCSSSDRDMIGISKRSCERMVWHIIARNLGRGNIYKIVVTKPEMYYLGNPVPYGKGNIEIYVEEN